MINIKNKIAIGSLMLAGILATSCEDDYDFADTSNQKAKVTAGQTNYSGSEGDTIYMEFQVENPATNPMDFKFEVKEGTTVSSEDFSVGDGHLVPDYGDPANFMYTADGFVESFKVPVYLYRNLSENEGTQTIELNMSATGSRLALTKDGGIDLTIVVEDEVTDEFVIRLAWDAEYTDEDGDTHSFCDFDLDLELLNANNNVIATSYSSCPEEINIFPGDLPDGTYQIQTSFYYNGGSALPVDYESIPASLTIAKRGVFANTIDLSGVWTDFEGGLDPDGDGTIDDISAYLIPATFEISGNTYTVMNANGDVIGQGRASTSNTNGLN